MPNIEIKASYKNFDNARKICESMNAVYVGIDYQVDTYFKVPEGRLKLRESNLGGAQLIPYIRPNLSGPKKSDYETIKVDNPLHLKKLFHQMLGIDIVVTKKREIYLIENVRVHLDEVEGLGSFFEFEAVYKNDTDNERDVEQSKIEKLMLEFGIQVDSLQTESYLQLLKDERRKKIYETMLVDESNLSS